MTSTDAIAGAAACLSIVALCGSLIFIPMLVQRTSNIRDELLSGSDEFKTLAEEAWARLRDARRSAPTTANNDGSRSVRSLRAYPLMVMRRAHDPPLIDAYPDGSAAQAPPVAPSSGAISSGSCQCNEQNACPPGPAGGPGLAGQDGDSGNPGLPGKPGEAYKARSEHQPGSDRPCVRCPPGPKGAPGEAGPAGKQGDKGKLGGNGPPGKDGSSGPLGPSGSHGAPGPDGKVGPIGPPGKDASSHGKGEPGDKGAPGSDGYAGLLGSVGPHGRPGSQGALGPPGSAGNVGASGSSGPKGPPGKAGEPGKDALYCKCPRRLAFAAKA